ncbi:MAG: ATP-binding protein [Lachnospiraceae bacterium]|nr:ATP-binding protein [Lachnospiraceae bacterium]
MTTNINEKITDFPIGTIDLVRILGILLDNALEACTASAKKFISIIFYKDTKSIFIQISNASPKIDTISLDNNIINRQSMNSISINNIDKLYEKIPLPKGNIGESVYMKSAKF